MKKLTKRLLGAFLAVMMVVTMTPNGAFKTSAAVAAQSTYATGDIIEYGSYPQTKVTNLDLINTLEAQTLSAENTVVYAGAKYQRVFFTTVTNSYQALNGYSTNTAYWFKFEPIQWRVLSNTAGELFVMAEKILDPKAYNQTAVNVTWETCTMRSWLNSDFYNTAFNSSEQAAIKTSTVVNEDYLTGTDGGVNTSDKLFLLSYNEAITSAYGFSSDYNTQDTARRAQGTDYSKSIGLYSSTESLYAGNSLWWLRTPGDNQTHFCILTTNGIIDTHNYNINHTGLGARPAFKINQSYLTTITFDSTGGSPVANLVGNIGAPVVAPADPTKAGFTFNGWNPTLPATFPVGGLAVTAQWVPKIYVTGDKIEYGSYPQSKITNTNLIAMLDAQTLSADNTVVYDGVKYQRVYFTTANNAYQALNGYAINTVYWFKFEPITWRVLSNTDDELLVMADKVLDSKAYNEDNTSVTWETSSIRSWLNNNFYNTAFSSTDRALITSTLINQDNSQYGTLGGNNTSDNVFLLSYADSLNTAYGFSSNNQTQDIARQANGTDFSKGNGLKVVTSGTSLGDVYWWLRTPGFFQYNACNVGIDGRPSISGSRVDYGYNGARPACIISLSPTSTIVFDSAGGTAVSPVTGGIGKTVHAVSAPSKAGFTFNGWDPALPATFPDSGLSTTAQWKVNYYHAYFYVDGELRSTENTAYGASIDAPYFYTKEGYTFAGWDPAVPATMPIHELTFNALWTINQSTITFDSAGGTAVASLTGDFGSAVPSVADPTKAGFIFNGWEPSLPATFPDGGLAVAAQWIMLGDVNSNGFITVTDALLTLQYASSLITLTFTQKIAADVYKDNNISVSDALKMLQYASGLITSF
ncbi:MAG: DUF6273 domain-containing protein [Eubacteriales bacterium]